MGSSRRKEALKNKRFQKYLSPLTSVGTYLTGYYGRFNFEYRAVNGVGSTAQKP